MPIRLGPLGLNPTLSITNFGIDTNIFNESSDPKSDFTSTVTPKLQARLRGGRVLLTGAIATGFVYYQKYDDERSVDYTTDGRVDANLGWFQPFAAVSWVDTRERLNSEIDVRAPRTQAALTAGTRFVVSSKTGIVVDFRRTGLDFEEGTEFDGVPLSQTMNSTSESIEAGLEFYLTPLTTLSVTASRQQDRFDLSPERDSDTFRVLPMLRMESPAIVQGSIGVGFRKFEPVSPDLPAFSGLIMQGSLTHTIADRTKLDFSVTRDVQYSFEPLEPYYVTTGFRVGVGYQLMEPVDIRATAGRERLEYRSDLLLAPVVVEEDRTDRTDVIGVGAGYRFRPSLRIGFDVEYAKRHSDRVERQYDRTRAFATVTYGY
jgi:hypothetical protein